MVGSSGVPASAVAAEVGDRCRAPVVAGPENATIDSWIGVLNAAGGVTTGLEAGGCVAVAKPEDFASAEVRRCVRSRADVVWIDDLDQAASADRGERRRWLGPLTTAADAIVDVAGRSPDELAIEVVGLIHDEGWPSGSTPLTHVVAFDDGRSYPIHVGRGIDALVADVTPERAARVAVVTQDGIGIEVETGREQQTFTVPAGEGAKTMAVVEDLCSRFARWGMTRADAVVTVGGGVVSDVGAFAAACYHRGVPVVHLSTTLLGQIDAAIGGKCGVNLAEGKNLVGAFWQPSAVLCDVDSLDTLPDAEFVAGMGELAKYHFLGGGNLGRLPLVERVAASARIKAEVVSGDEREGGRRAVLNYGHTLAHALETASNYRIRHGEAVAVGLLYAAAVARRLGRIDDERVATHRTVVSGYGLATTIPRLLTDSGLDAESDSFDPEALIDLFSRDKKAIDGVTFVLDGPDGVEPVRVEDRQLLRECFDEMVAP